MIGVYEVFKILFGLIISGVIIAFFFNYAGNVSQTQQDILASKVIRNFISTANDVYLTGNSINFTQFSKSQEIGFDAANRPYGVTYKEADKFPVYFPLFFSPAENLFIDRGELDLGFVKFPYATAMPETTIVFNVLDERPEAWELVKEIAELLPSTSARTPKVTFALCDGASLKKGVNLCGKSVCEKFEFIQAAALSLGGLRQDMCLLELDPAQRLVSISNNCPDPEGSLCVTTRINGIGYIHFGENLLVFKDALDIVAVIIGGIEKDRFGRVLGLNYYYYKNEVFKDRIGMVSDILASEARILQSEIRGCQEYYINLEKVLVSDHDSVKNLLTREYYKDAVLMERLAGKLAEAKTEFESNDKGCVI